MNRRADVLIYLLPALIACHGPAAIDYRAADPVADAHRAMVDSGDFHMLGIRVGDSVITPRDTSVLLQHSYSVEVGPHGGMIVLPTAPAGDAQAQIQYVTRYNTELFALLDTNAMGAGLLPNQRLKLAAPRRSH